MADNDQAHEAHRCAEQDNLREQVRRLHDLIGEMDRASDKYVTELEQLRALLRDTVPEWMRDTEERENDGNYLGPSKVYLSAFTLLRARDYYRAAELRALEEELGDAG